MIEVIDAHGAREAYALPALTGGDGALAEAPPGDPLWAALARAALEGTRLAGDGCALQGHAGPAPAPQLAPGRRLLGADQTRRWCSASGSRSSATAGSRGACTPRSS